MKNVKCIRLLSVLMCLIAVLGAFSSCGSKKNGTEVNNTKAAELKSPLWLISPSIEADGIEPIVRADYNKSTRHYDISYADCFKIKKNGKYGIIDYNGKTVIPAEYDSIFAVRNSEDFIAVKKDKNGEKSQTYINYKDFSTEPAYKSYNTLRYEYLWSTEESKAVYIQNDNGEIYEDELKPALPESVRGVKTVDGEYTSDGTYGLYVEGKNIMGMIYSGAGSFSNGMAAFKSNGIWGYIDSNGKTVIPFGYDAVKGYSAFGGDDTPYESYDGYVTVTKNGKFGIFSNEGKMITELIFDGATPVVGGRAYVLKDGKWGLVSFGDSADASARTEAKTTEKTTETTTEKATEKTTEKTTENETTNETTTSAQTGNYVVNTDGLKLRADIGTENDVLTVLDYGTRIYIDKVSDGWGHTVYDGLDGWVSLDYAEKE